MKKWNLFNILTALCCMVFVASCSGNSGDEDTPGTGGNVSGELVLTATKSFISADGQDATVFTVKKGNTDVTAEATIYKDNEVYSSTSFSTATAGDYVFFASYEGEISAKITIRATEGGTSGVPADPNPDQFDGFKQRVVAIQSTGLWCGNCPLMITAIEAYQKTDADAIFVAAHNGDVMANNYSNAVNSFMGITAYPSLTINMNSAYTVGAYGDPDLTVQEITAVMGDCMQKGAQANIAAAVSLSDDESTLTVQAKVKVAETAQYRIAAWVLEDNVYNDEQENYYPELGDDFTNHSNVLRLSSSEKAYGDQLGQSSTLPQGSVNDYSCTLNLSNASISSLSNCRVVIIVTAPDGGKFAINNAVVCPIDGTVAFEYE